jgi:serine/threonine protein kinase
VIHRDIKPDNLVLNNLKELVLVDFGLSKKFEGENDIIKATAGSCLFFAPEVVKTGVKNKVFRGRQTDIWATGVTFYYIATKVYPFAAGAIYEISELLNNHEVDYELICKQR